MVLNGKTIAVQYFQLKSAQLIKSSVYRVLHTALSSRICEHFGVQFKLGTTGSICLTVLNWIYTKSFRMLLRSIVCILHQHTCLSKKGEYYVG